VPGNFTGFYVSPRPTRPAHLLTVFLTIKHALARLLASPSLFPRPLLFRPLSSPSGEVFLRFATTRPLPTPKSSSRSFHRVNILSRVCLPGVMHDRSQLSRLWWHSRMGDSQGVPNRATCRARSSRSSNVLKPMFPIERRTVTTSSASCVGEEGKMMYSTLARLPICCLVIAMFTVIMIWNATHSVRLDLLSVLLHTLLLSTLHSIDCCATSIPQ